VTRFSFCLVFLVAALPALAEDILPAVPTGGMLQGESILRTGGGVTLANTRVTISAPSGCVTFGGASSTEATTDPAGLYTFMFTAGSTPGPCRIEGRAGATTSYSETLIYRHADVVLATDKALQTINVNGTTSFTLTASANGATLYGVPVTLEMVFPGSAAGTLHAPSPWTGISGTYSFTVNGNAVAGAYDIVARAGNAARLLRVSQVAPPVADPPGNSVRLQIVPSNMGEVRLSIVDAPSFCRINNAFFVRDITDRFPAPGMSAFPLGLVQMDVDCPQNSARLRLDYPSALPADGVMHVNGVNPGAGPTWTAIPATVSGNSVTFTVTDEGVGDRLGTPGKLSTVVGVAKPGAYSAPPPIPVVKDMWWAGPQENGWGMSIAQSDQGLIFGAIYAYDDSGRPTWWTVPGGFWDVTHSSFDSDLYAPYGSPWYAHDPRITVNGTSLGPIKITVLDGDHATIDFSIKSVAGHKSLQRQVFGAPGSSPLSGVGGMWWGGQPQSGWGVSIVQQNATLFAVWYTYDELNKPTWFVMPGGNWTSGDTYEGRMYRTRGSPWLGQAYDASKLQVIDVGPYKIKFSGANATLDYSVEGRTGTLALTRQGPF
jgi:hypothetical protein